MLAALRLGVGKNHLLDVRQPLLRKKHMLCPAKTNAFGAEFPCDCSIARDVRIGTNSEPPDLIRHPHKCVVPAVRTLFLSSILIDSAPTTQHFPIPRATTAAWLVMPPREVKIPTATSIP